ncbi:Phospholipase D/Transphosphatidylase [Macleaya cordata]|uniref:Phospholipase D n=1 Tax=Macleaya cordata TaxID=56857 RepID=A0A200QDC6_MACCD|nr:Phospholipase D/Transphosphatidylase [Macleaya cordata]
MEAKQNKFFHGTLEATIFHATPYRPTFPFNCACVSEKATYVTIKINQKKVAETNHVYDRVWNQTFQILCAHPSESTITITMKTKCSILGEIHIPACRMIEESTLIEGFYPTFTEKGKQNPELKLQFMLWFKHANCEPSWEKVLNHGEFMGLKNATFPQRSNCNVTLYQDAHHHSTFQPPVNLHGEGPRKLWVDVFKAINGARHLIYIAGWSFNPKMVLVRDGETDIPHARGVKIGELLKQKAEDGVAVRIMLWDDETSLPFIKNKGVMRTHDEDAFDYFKHSKVVCRLCPRLHNKFPTFFAHHQKTITVDTQAKFPSANSSNEYCNSSTREIMSFIGGLDLCDGRYDTEEHSLFRTLNTEYHAQDFYQINLAGASLQKGGPREPWHDVHACITGEAAWDVLSNFEQRWTKQCNPSLLFPTRTIPNLSNSSYRQHVEPQVGDWKVQVFRSIDRVSATSLPDNLSVECSIHEAYVEAIRRAERFIYIENQYFIGACHMWEKDRNCGCKNLIPVEIALKVINKIKAKERFAVYIVIPMWPEGLPDSEPVQEILYWTRQTMAMMYRLIGEAIQESREPVHPRDYLNFFCLANREKKRREEFVPPYSPQHETQYWKAQTHRRFMVYVHSKLMIVDDMYILIGSANINQRSMDGGRDTEIAMGCYQPKYARNKTSNGDVHAFRMSLWYEHTGRVDECFLEPHSLDCVRRIRAIGDEMWSLYSGEEVVDMEGIHLVTYPVNVSKDGSIEDPIEGGANFPDTTTPIKGKRSKVLPAVCTT